MIRVTYKDGTKHDYPDCNYMSFEWGGIVLGSNATITGNDEVGFIFKKTVEVNHTVPVNTVWLSMDGVKCVENLRKGI